MVAEAIQVAVLGQSYTGCGLMEGEPCVSPVSLHHEP